jgi:sugar phosphate isomerase/epimerase
MTQLVHRLPIKYPAFMYTRRDFGRIAAAGMPLGIALGQARKIDSTIAGVRLGTQTYSFREKPLDGVIAAMVEVGLGDCEVFSPHIEPRPAAGSNEKAAGGNDKTAREAAREALRKWRLTVPLDEIKAMRQKFTDAGIAVYALNLSFNDSFTEEEIDRGFAIAKAFGVDVITDSGTLTSAKRVVPFAEKHKVTVAFHNHSDVTHPNEFAKPESFAEALKMSKQFAINLDIGHFTAANYDAAGFIKEHHDRILVLHLKDRKKNQGDNLPWGQGDTPIKPVLQLLKKEKYPIRAFIEYEYRGTDSITEVKKCFQFCKDALA